jgi:conjugative transfer signal peptidase TraF
MADDGREPLDSHPLRRFSPSRGASWQAVAVLTGIATAFALLVASGVLKLNLTESMPLGLYLLRRTTTVHVGDIVIACLPPAVQRVGIANGYLARAYGLFPGSRCAAGSAPVLKYAVALAGDELEIDEGGLSLNGRRLSARSRALVDRCGRRLAALTNGRYRLGDGDVWLYSPERYSWDSRYFGPVKQTDILGIAMPIWTAKGLHSYESIRSEARVKSMLDRQTRTKMLSQWTKI